MTMDKYGVHIEDFAIFSGESFEVTVNVRFDGEPIKLTSNDVLRFYVFRGSLPIIKKTYTAANQEEDGSIQIELTPSETEALTLREYPYEAEMQIGSDNIKKVMRGIFHVNSSLIVTATR